MHHGLSPLASHITTFFFVPLFPLPDGKITESVKNGSPVLDLFVQKGGWKHPCFDKQIWPVEHGNHAEEGDQRKQPALKCTPGLAVKAAATLAANPASQIEQGNS